MGRAIYLAFGHQNGTIFVPFLRYCKRIISTCELRTGLFMERQAVKSMRVFDIPPVIFTTRRHCLIWRGGKMFRRRHFSTLHQTGAPIVRSHGLSWSLRSRCARGSAFGSGLLTGSRGVGTRGSQCCRVACACVESASMIASRAYSYFMPLSPALP